MPRRAGQRLLVDAVASKQVVAVDGSAWASSGGPLAVNLVLADLAQALT